MINAYMKIQIARLKADNLDTIISIANFIVFQFIQILFIFIMYSTVDLFKGWYLGEMIFLHGFFNLTYYFDKFLSDNFLTLEQKINKGVLDKYLIRPKPVIFQLLLEKNNFIDLFVSVFGLVFIVYSFKFEYISLDFFKIIFLIVSFFFVVFVRSLFKLLLASIAFWTRTSFVFAITFSQITEYSKYPITIFPVGIRFVFLTIIPISIFGSLPVGLILGKFSFIPYGVILVIFLIFLPVVTYYVWKKGLSRYVSTGN